MEQLTIFDFIGYAGSVLIAFSLLMTSIIKLRWLNLAGATLFSTYGFIIGALPVGILNSFICLINIYHLQKIYSKKEYFKILQIRPQNQYMEYFIDFYHKDINDFFPGFCDWFKNNVNTKKDILSFLVLRNAAVAGFFMGHKIDDETLMVDIDFAIPEYRDFKVGKYIYEKNSSFFTDQNIKWLYADPKCKIHYDYLKKMKFSEKELAGKKVIMMKRV